ncbi:MAG: GNAT family N-acetyltransferase [Clostridium sp.]
MDYIIKKVTNNDLDTAFSLIGETFSEFIAPDYSQEAVDNFFKNFIGNNNFKEGFKNGKQIMYGAYIKETLVGVMSIREDNHVSCVFVNKKYHRQGIATKLFNHMISELKNRQIKKITLHASPYAVPFYHSIGFKDLAKQQTFQGILFTPMEYTL